MIRWLSGTVLKWRARNSRSRFPLGFDDHMLRDIDLTRLEVIYSEFTKPNITISVKSMAHLAHLR